MKQCCSYKNLRAKYKINMFNIYPFQLKRRKRMKEKIIKRKIINLMIRFWDLAGLIY